MSNYPPAEQRPTPVALTPHQQAIYNAICHDGIPADLLNSKAYRDIEHFLWSIAHWVAQTYQDEQRCG